MSDTIEHDPNAAWEPSNLPPAGKDRFWRLERQPKNQTKPVKISLMQQLEGTSSRKFAMLVGFGAAPAIPTLIYEEARKVLDIHGRTHEVIGDYDGGAA